MPEENHDDDFLEYPIDGTLDLHTFNPKEVRELLPVYLNACLDKDIFEVRVIHGKGTGALRETVHSILQKSPYVASFKLADEGSGGWGATIVILKPPMPDSKE
ncbi:MAG TPA: Smr/MutS family protein [Dissulfurispiraceae bacterium]|nr:Smr/MutS family protein [Dissulfurispiraceae bacterium]